VPIKDGGGSRRAADQNRLGQRAMKDQFKAIARIDQRSAAEGEERQKKQTAAKAMGEAEHDLDPSFGTRPKYRQRPADPGSL